MINKLKYLVNTEEKKRLLSNFISLLILQGANYILPLITFPYLVRVLGIEKFGLIAFANAFVSYFNILTEYGFNLTATKEISIYRGNKEKIEEIFSSVMIIKIFLMIVSFILLLILVFSIDKFKDHYEVFLLAFGIVVGQVLFPQWFFQGIERMKYITFLNILAKTIFTITIFIFIHDSNDYLYVPLLNSLGFIISGLISLWIIFENFNIKFKFQKLDILKYYFIDGGQVFIASFLGFFYRNFNILFLGFVGGNIVVGYYVISERVIRIIHSFQKIIGNTFFPFFSKKIFENKHYFFIVTKKYLIYIVIFSFILSILVFLFSKDIIFLINGKNELHSVLDLKILSWTLIFEGFNFYLITLGLIPLGYQKDLRNILFKIGIISIGFAIVLINLFNDIGASINFLFTEIILFLFLLRKITLLKKKYEKNIDNRI